MSPSSHMIKASFPPNSSDECAKWDAQFVRASIPASVDPVRVTKFTLGFDVRAFPTTPPLPCTTLMTPAGTPASTNNSTYLVNVKGLTLAGFSIHEFPIKRAGGILLIKISLGKLKGMIATHTPRGCCIVYCIVFSCPFSVPLGIKFP